MARVNHKRVKQLLNEKRSKITDKQFFTSRILAGHFEDIAAAQTRRYKYNRRVHVNLYWQPQDPNVACTNNVSILINSGNPMVAPFPQQIDPTRQIHRCCGRAAHQIAKGKEVPTWIRLLSG